MSRFWPLGAHCWQVPSCSKINTSDPWPAGRYSHAAVMDADDCIWVFGGEQAAWHLDELWKFSTQADVMFRILATCIAWCVDAAGRRRVGRRLRRVSHGHPQGILMRLLSMPASDPRSSFSLEGVLAANASTTCGSSTSRQAGQSHAQVQTEETSHALLPLP